MEVEMYSPGDLDFSLSMPVSLPLSPILFCFMSIAWLAKPSSHAQTIP